MIAPDQLIAAASGVLLDTPGATRLTRARWAVAWALRQRGLSTPEIGRIIGRHHTTVSHALTQVGNLAGEEGRVFNAAVAAVKLLIGDLPSPAAPADELIVTVEEARAIACNECITRPAFPSRPTYLLRVEREPAGHVEVLATQGRPPAVAWRLASLDPKALARALDRR